MSQWTIKCTECNKDGGTIPKYHQGGLFSDNVKEMMHPECALAQMVRYIAKKELEESESL